MQAYVDSHALDTTTGSKTRSPGSLGFQPAGGLFATNGLTADGTGTPMQWSIGAAQHSTDERSQACLSEDAQNTTDCHALASASSFMNLITATGTADAVADFTSYNTGPNGYTYNLSNAPTAAAILNALLLDVAVETGVFNLGTGNGNKSIASLSGTPKAVIFFTATAPTAGDTLALATGNATVMLGWMCADGTQGVAGTRHTDAVAAADTARWQHTGRCIDMRTVSADLVNAAFVSMDANGFTVNATVTTANIRVYFVAIMGGEWTAGAFDSSTTTGTTDISTTGLDPAATVLLSFGMAANTATQTHGYLGWGTTDGTRHFALAHTDRDTADPTETDVALDRTITLAVPSTSGGTISIIDEYVVTHGTGKFTYDHTVASGTAHQVLWLAGGNASAPTGSLLFPSTPLQHLLVR